jgi:hypothetical protein
MKMIWSGALVGRDRRRLAGGSARRRHVMVVVAAGAAVVCAGLLTGAASAPAAAAARVGTAGVQWGRAEGVPGLPAGNIRGNATVTTLSCWSVNNCAAGGYTVYGGHEQVFLVTERNGRWDRAEKVPGLAKLNTGDSAAGVVSVSCAPGGYCAAGGYYTDSSKHQHPFVVTGVKGRWRAAMEVPGKSVDKSWYAGVTSVSCPSAGNCAAAGTDPGFVVSQTKGRWHVARRVPGLAVSSANLGSVSCWSAGNCAAGGSSGGQALVVTERNGVWGTPEEVPGTAALNTGNTAGVNSVSCARDGYCAVGGYYQLPSTGPDSPAYDSPFVASGRKGRWRAAVAWPSAPVLNGGDGPDEGDIIAVSCPSAGSCAAAGNGTLFSGPVFVVSQKNGVWGTPRRLRGIPVENLTGVTSLSCPSAGNCGAGGRAALRTGSFVASEENGRWTKAENVPGMTAFTKRSDRSAVNVVSCPSAGHCTAAGTDAFHPSYYHAFVTGP